MFRTWILELALLLPLSYKDTDYIWNLFIRSKPVTDTQLQYWKEGMLC